LRKLEENNSPFLNDLRVNLVIESFKALCERYEDNQLGLILAPGVDTGYGFDGSGVYKIKVS
jgi:hypothetical protein